MRIRWLFVAALLAACDGPKQEQPELGESVPGSAVAGPIQFHFAPPDGTEFVETIFRRTSSHCEALPSTMFETEEKIAVKIRRSESGYRMTTRHLSIRAWHNGSGYNDPYLNQRVGMELTHRIDEKGRLLAVDGTGEIARQTQARLDALPVPRIAVGEPEMFASHAYQWNRQVGALAGSTIAIGGAIETASPLPLPIGRPIPIPERYSVARLAYCPAPRCVLVWLEGSSSDSALAEQVVAWVASHPTLKRQKYRPKAIGSGVTLQADLIIDPETMLLHLDKGSQVWSYEIDLPGYGRAHFKTTQEWRYTFDYPATPAPSASQAARPFSDAAG